MDCLQRLVFFDELEKIAKVTTELQPHQKRVVDRITREDQPGLLVVHGTGSGKTLTSLAAHEALDKPGLVVTPASLQENYLKEIKKHTKGATPPRTMLSLQRLARLDEPLESKPVLILDEAHRIRDGSSKSKKRVSEIEAEKRLLLTASPFYNHPSDVSSLINVAAGEDILPQNKRLFEDKYIVDEKIPPGLLGWVRGVKPGVVKKLNPKRKKEIAEHFSKWTDFHPGSTKGYPEVTREDVRVPMSKKQLRIYDALLGKAPAWVQYKVKKGLPPSKTELRNLNKFLSMARQVSNTTAAYQPNELPEQPKIDAAVARLRKNLDSNPASKAVVYSNFLNSGIGPYKKMLDESKIPYGEFSGGVRRRVRDQIVRDYNKGKLRALLLSSAGGEGLDLRGTRLLQVLDPHWNDEKLKQVEGRGIRFGSHAHLPPEEQKVHVERYLATRPKSGILNRVGATKPGGSSDEYLEQMSQTKVDLINQFKGLLEANTTAKGA